MKTISLIHVISGILIALTGLLQIILKKGGKLHHVIGTIYFLSWPVVVVTGWILGSFLIAMLGALGFYMAYTGYRFGRLRNTKLNIFDQIVIVSAVFFAVGILGFGIHLLLTKKFVFGAILLFFGIIFSFISVNDINGYIRNKNNRNLSGHPLEWFFEHYTRMYISYIAAMTAFTVIQNPFPFFVALNWTLPTVIGTVIIILTSRHYRKKYNIKPKSDVITD